MEALQRRTGYCMVDGRSAVHDGLRQVSGLAEETLRHEPGVPARWLRQSQMSRSHQESAATHSGQPAAVERDRRPPVVPARLNIQMIAHVHLHIDCNVWSDLCLKLKKLIGKRPC